jgi:hypothetical protein
MSKLGPNLSLSEEQLDDVLQEMDGDGNGEISYEEFAAFMSKKFVHLLTAITIQFVTRFLDLETGAPCR